MNTEVTREVAIDTEIAEAYHLFVTRRARVRDWLPYVAHAAGYRNRRATEADVRRFINDNIADWPTYKQNDVNENLATLDARIAKTDEAAAAYVEANQKYEGWSRFFMVPGGHIHESMGCSTCNKNGRLTDFVWLPELSGLTEAEAVAQHGTVLCSTCFPSAPVEWTANKSKKGDY